jgi:two-component system heavy metal sensor histidine kinase CusS
MSWNLSNRVALGRRGTLAFQLTAGYALAGLVLVFFGTASLYLVLRAELEKSTELFLADKLNVLRTILRERPEDWDALREEIELESAAREYQQFYIRLLDGNNKLLLATPGMEERFAVEPFAPASAQSPIAMKGRTGEVFRITSAQVPVGQTSTERDTIQIAVDVSHQEGLLARFRMWFWIILSVASAVFPLIGYQVARHGIRPVEEMATTARHISSSNMHERIQPEGYPLEFASLAGTFNQMLDRLEDSFERMSRFSADIAHDLRTPVNNIRGEAEVALARGRTVEEYREVLGSCLEEAVRLSDLIGDLLFLARADSPLMHLRRERADVRELLGGVRDYYEVPAAEGGISLTTMEGSEPVMAEFDRTLLQRAVANLVSNAIAHTPAGGSVVMGTKTSASAICIEVSDTGVGIPPEALPKVFDRFFRVDQSRSKASGGTGLGLSIVQSIMLLHGGDAEIASQPGRGTRVTLRMPLSVAPPNSPAPVAKMTKM